MPPHRCQLNQLTIVADIFQLYGQNPDLTAKEVRVRFQNEQGVDGGGLIREVFALFWEQMECKMERNTKKVPIVTPDNQQQFFQLGQILSHGYVITVYFTLSLAQAFATALISTEAVSDVFFFSPFIISLRILKPKQFSVASQVMKTVLMYWKV